MNNKEQTEDDEECNLEVNEEQSIHRALDQHASVQNKTLASFDQSNK